MSVAGATYTFLEGNDCCRLNRVLANAVFSSSLMATSTGFRLDSIPWLIVARVMTECIA